MIDGSTGNAEFVGAVATALRMDSFWAIHRPYAESAVLSLLGRRDVNASAAEAGRMAAVFAASAMSSGQNADKTPEQVAASINSAMSSASLLQGRNIGDTSGTTRAPFGQNADGTRKPYPVDGGVAMLAITGPMSKEDAWCMDGTSTIRARRIIRQVKADGDVKAVLIRFDSPGGTVSGNDDLAMDVRACALVKPTYGYCEDCCASAAYYVGAQCNCLYANPSALIGSIATIMSFVDYSEMLAKAGITVQNITPDDAPFKGSGTPGTSLTPEMLAYYKGIVNAFAGQFRSAVKKGRGLTDEQMAKVIDGRVFIASEARSLGLIDGVTSYDNVLAKLKSYRAPK